ncbi:MAG: hypothetical protein ACREBC_16380 [Pyrinomonadaceae bacterium]
MLEKILRGVSAQKYTETVINSAEAFGVSRMSVSRKLVELTAQKLQLFKERPLFLTTDRFSTTFPREEKELLKILFPA